MAAVRAASVETHAAEVPRPKLVSLLSSAIEDCNDEGAVDAIFDFDVSADLMVCCLLANKSPSPS